MQKSSTICNYNINVCQFSYLNEKLRCYLLTFVRCNGKLKKIMREMNITRDEAKSLTNELMSVVGDIPNKNKQSNLEKSFSAITQHTGNRFVFDTMNR